MKPRRLAIKMKSKASASRYGIQMEMRWGKCMQTHMGILDGTHGMGKFRPSGGLAHLGCPYSNPSGNPLVLATWIARGFNLGYNWDYHMGIPGGAHLGPTRPPCRLECFPIWGRHGLHVGCHVCIPSGAHMGPRCSRWISSGFTIWAPYGIRMGYPHGNPSGIPLGGPRQIPVVSH